MSDNYQYKLKSYVFIDPPIASTGGVSTLTIATAGTGYVVGDLITLIAGNSNCILRVATITTPGGVATYTISDSGSEYAVANGIASTTNSVLGVGFIANITAVVLAKVALSLAITDSAMVRQFFVFRVDIQGLYSNTGFVAIGNVPIPTDGKTYLGTESGYQLAAGQVITLNNVDLSEVFMLPQTSGEGIIVSIYLRQTS